MNDFATRADLNGLLGDIHNNIDQIERVREDVELMHSLVMNLHDRVCALEDSSQTARFVSSEFISRIAAEFAERFDLKYDPDDLSFLESLVELLNDNLEVTSQ